MRNKQIGVMQNVISHHKNKNRALNKFENIIKLVVFSLQNKRCQGFNFTTSNSDT